MSRRAARGFTLLEVMVAMAILALGLLGIADVVGNALRSQVRATHLETATLLARGKLAAVQDDLERTGFRDFEQAEEGDFEDEGHPEIAWRLQVVKPEVDLGPEAIARLLGGGEGDLGALLGQPAESGGRTAADPMQAAITAVMNQQLTVLGEQIKKGVREVRLTVSWSEGGDRTESFTVVTHMVVLTPKGGA